MACFPPPEAASWRKKIKGFGIGAEIAPMATHESGLQDARVLEMSGSEQWGKKVLVSPACVLLSTEGSQWALSHVTAQEDSTPGLCQAPAQTQRQQHH